MLFRSNPTDERKLLLNKREINKLIGKMISFGQKKEKEFLGLKNIQKLKMLNTVKMK